MLGVLVGRVCWCGGCVVERVLVGRVRGQWFVGGTGVWSRWGWWGGCVIIAVLVGHMCCRGGCWWDGCVVEGVLVGRVCGCGGALGLGPVP